MPRHVHPLPFIIQPPDDLVRQRPDLRRGSHALSLKYAGRQVVTEADLQAMGSALWGALPPNVHEAFDAAHAGAGAAILSVIIESDAADAQALPWETLYHPALGFIGKHAGLTLTRRIRQHPERTLSPELVEGAKRQLKEPLDKGPLRVLLFTSLPDDVNPETGRLNVEEEQAQVQEALLPWISKGLAQLEMPDDGRFATLQDWLKRFQPHVLFLSGHGNFHHEPHTGEAPYGEFFFESETGNGQKIKEHEIAQALVGMGVQAVVLSACESSKAASDALTNGLAQRLSALGIPHVIGMRESILDRAGIQFARALCDELARRERMDIALQAARIAIQTPLKDISRREAGMGAAEELSLGQWCLPMLLSANPHQPLIDWDFPPQASDARVFNQRLDTVSLPARFVGRRAEMRRYKSDLLNGKLQKLLITGPGGQGKTSLAGKLALDLQKQGWRVFAWSARPENQWQDFERDLALALDEARVNKYERFRLGSENGAQRARYLLSLLLEQFDGRVVFFFDNLESLQDLETLALQDALVDVWLNAAQSNAGVILLATSRWRWPAWDGELLTLSHANYGDFLQMAQQLARRGQLQTAFLEKRERLRKVYDVLGGNSRGLEFFAAATLELERAEEEAFLDRLAETKSDLQANMAIEMIYAHLPPTAKTFLARLPAHYAPAPAEGLLKLGLDLADDPRPLLERLLAVSLLEAQSEPAWEVIEYQCAPLVTDWLREQNLADADPRWLNAVADYHVYLFNNERYIVSQAIVTHHALRRAGRHDEADRLTLDAIVGPLTMAGFYATLLTEWLPRICGSENLQTRGEALGQTGRLLIHTGDYEVALDYLQQSLTLIQQIGDKAGEGTTLNNISTLYHAQGDYETALAYLKQSLTIWQQIGDKAGEGTTLNNLSQIYDAQGDYATALMCLKQSLAIQQQIGDIKGESVTLNNISQILQVQGDYETALEYSKRDLAICQQIGDKAGEGATLNNISQIYDAQGDYATALGYLKQSLTIRQQIGDKAGEGTTLSNIGSIYHAQGDYATALAYLKQALAIMQQIGNIQGESVILNNLSQIFKAQDDYEMALEYSKRDLAICQQIGDKAGEGTTLNNISALYHAQGDYETALAYLKQSLVIRQQIGDRAGLCTTLFNMGHIHAQNNQMQEAAGAWVTSYMIAKQINLAQGLQALADLAPQLGMPEGLAGWEALAQRMQSEESGGSR